MKKTNFVKSSLLLALVFILGVVVSGCFKSPVDKATEKAFEKKMEQESGQKVNADFNKDSVRIESEDGSVFEMGNNVDVPKDVPIYPGSEVVGKVQGTNPNGEQGQVYTMLSDDDPKEIIQFYKAHYAKKGYTVNGETSINGLETLGLKDSQGDVVAVMVTEDPDENKTSIILTIAEEVK